MNFPHTFPALISVVVIAGFSPSTKSIYCVNKQLKIEGLGGPTKILPGLPGGETFTWFKDNGLIEVTTLREGKIEKIKVPAILNGYILKFLPRITPRSSVYMNTITGGMTYTTYGSGVNGDYIITGKYSCSGL